jgi:HEAT repeat protein
MFPEQPNKTGVRRFAQWLAATALLAIVGCGGDPVASLIRELQDEETAVRRAAAIAINRLDPNDLDHQRVLIDAMKSGEGGIIVRVGQMSPNAAWAVPTMIELLNDRRPGIRRITANALEQIGSAGVAAKPSLKRLALSDPDERVREAAERALVGLNSSGSPAGETSPTPAVE